MTEVSQASSKDEAGDMVFGLIGPVGCDLTRIEDAVQAALGRFSYETRFYKLSELFDDQAIADVVGRIDRSSEFQRITTAMNAGDELRRLSGRNDIMAIYAASAICKTRNKSDAQVLPFSRVAHVIHSLKRPEEVFALRRIYGHRFGLISVYVPRAERSDRLRKKGLDERQALDLLLRDEQGELAHGQATAETFHLADLFLDGRANPEDLETELLRFMDLLFGSRMVTPTRHEHAMFSAYAGSLRSGDLSRQVGAVLVDSRGSVLAMGCNDAPRFAGGQYWPERGDARDIALGEDSNDRIKREIIRKILEGLKTLRQEADVLEQAKSLLAQTGLLDITEYGRAVHAEMAAVTDCARRGVSTQGSMLYCTTFPCHNCVKHLVAAGVERAYFIEPYPKSRALELHGDSVSSDELVSERLRLLPFVGIGPRRYSELFALQDPTGDRIRRKGTLGRTIPWDRTAASFMQERLLSYLEREQLDAATMMDLKERLEAAKQRDPARKAAGL